VSMLDVTPCLGLGNVTKEISEAVHGA